MFSLKRLLLIVGIVVFIAFLGGVGFVASTLFEYPLELLQVTQFSELNRVRAASVLDGDSEIRKDQLHNYLLFSSLGVSQQQFITEKERMRVLVPQKKSFYLNDNLKLPGLRSNDCSDLYCYQHRLTLGEIPSFFWKGLINTEDRRFLEHQGIDFKGIARALAIDILKMKMVQGASTLTQQLIKNLFLSNEKKISRKLKEMILAVYVEWKFSKEDIMTIYFNEIYWGSFQGIRIKGIYAASLFYFKKPIGQLNPFEATILISLLKGPNFYGPISHLERLKQRVKVVYKKLKDTGLVSTEDQFEWSDEYWDSWQEGLVKLQQGKEYRSLVRIARSDYRFLSDFEKYVFAQSAQQIENEAMKWSEKATDERIKTLALIYSLDSEKEERFAYYSRWGYNPYEYAEKNPRQVGSTLKPIIYGELLKFGVNLEQKVSTLPVHLKIKSGVWSPKEAGRVKAKEVPVFYALQHSYNNPMIRLVDKVGFDVLEPSLKKIIPQLQIPLAEYPAQLLGAVELTPKNLLDAYKRFLEDQCKIDPTLKSGVVAVMSDASKTTLRFRVDKRLAQMEFFGKTGTTNNSVDNLFVFFEGKLLGVIWVGIEGRRPEKSLHLGGSKTAFRIFQNFVLNRGKRFNVLNCPKSILKEIK